MFIPCNEAACYWAAWVCNMQVPNAHINGITTEMVHDASLHTFRLAPSVSSLHSIEENLLYSAAGPAMLLVHLMGIWTGVLQGGCAAFIDFINYHCPTEDFVPVLIAHNGKTFDIPFLDMEFACAGMQIPAKWHYMDTLSMARSVINQDAS